MKKKKKDFFGLHFKKGGTLLVIFPFSWTMQPSGECLKSVNQEYAQEDGEKGKRIRMEERRKTDRKRKRRESENVTTSEN